LRLVGEALDQGGAATQEDLAKALGVTARTIRADIAALEAQENRVATRGKLRGVGRGQTHKAAIVELYLKRYTYTEIMRRTRHSAYAIKRYIRTFGRVVMLRGKGLSTPEIAYAVGISERLVEEYLDLYGRYDVPAYQDRLTEIVQRIGGPLWCQVATPKGGRSGQETLSDSPASHLPGGRGPSTGERIQAGRQPPGDPDDG
jgi:DNA-binding Lrp family transcriptional regulator